MAFMKPNLLWLDDESSTLQPDEPHLIEQVLDGPPFRIMLEAFLGCERGTG